MSAVSEWALDRVRYWAEEVMGSRRERNNAIVFARKQGLPLRAIAEAAGLSAPGVVDILRRYAPNIATDDEND